MEYNLQPRSSCRRLRLILPLVLGLVSGTRLPAATLNAALDRDTIYEGETAEVAVTVQNARTESAPVPPEAESLTFQLTPQFESRQTFINGVLSSSRVYRFVVQSSGPGEFVIPPFSMEVEGATLRSRPLRLRVLPGQSPTISQFALVELRPGKRRVYLGEALPVEIAVAYRGGRYREAPRLEQEGLTLGPMEQLAQRVERFGGVDYTVDPFRTYVIAARSGVLKLGPATLSFGLPVRSRLGVFGRELMAVGLRSGVIDLEVLPLPAEGAPAGFTGAVGQYTMKVEASTNVVTAGDPILVTIEISGDGPIESLQLESATDWEGFKTYAPETSVELIDKLGLQGTKRFTQVVIPQSAEVKELPSIQFSYFDPKQQRYRTLLREAIPIAVRRGTVAASYPEMPGLGNAETTPAEVAREIVHIKSRLGEFGAVQPSLAMRPWFPGLHALPLAVWLGAVYWRRRQARLAGDPSLRRRKEVARLVRVGLAELRQAAGRNEPETFFAIVFRLLQERLGERAGLPATAIDELNLDQVLQGRVDAELLAEIHGLFRACNMARYAPGRMNEVLASFIPRVETVLARLEKVTRA